MKRIKNEKINLGLNFLLLLFTFQNSRNIAWLPSRVRVGKEISKFNLNFVLLCFPSNSLGKESACNAGDPSLIPGLGRSAREGIGYPASILGLPWWLSWWSELQFSYNEGDLDLIPGLERSPGEGKYSGLENSMDYIVRGVAKRQTGLSDFHFCRLSAFLYGSWMSSTPRFCEM